MRWTERLVRQPHLPDRPVLALVGDRTVRLHDVWTGQLRGSWRPGHTGGITSVVGSAAVGDLIWLATGSIDQTVRLWWWSGAPRPVRRHGRAVRIRHPRAVTSLVITPGLGDGLLLLSGGGRIQRWTPPYGEPAGQGDLMMNGKLATVTGPAGNALVVRYGMTGTQVYGTGGHGALGPVLTGHRGIGGARAVCAVPLEAGTRTFLATAGADLTIRLWDLAATRGGRGRPDADSSATAIAVLPLTEGRTGLAVAAGASPVRILDLADGEVAAPYLRCWSDRLAAVPIPRQRRWVLAAGGVGSDHYYLAVWDSRLGKPISTPIPGRPDPPTARTGQGAGE
jgi:WD40 repeat protein